VGLPLDSIYQLKQAPTWQHVTGIGYAAHGAVLSKDAHDHKNIGGQAYCFPWQPPTDTMFDTLHELGPTGRPRLVAVGHTHRPTLGWANQWAKPRGWHWAADLEVYRQDSWPLPGDVPVLIGPGSVGQPRFVGKDNRAAYALVDLTENRVYFKQVAYDQGEFKAGLVLSPPAGTNWDEGWPAVEKNLEQWGQQEI
jgi:hypothetical protein